MNVEITRFETGSDGTVGVMTINRRLFAITMEPPENGNKPNISCIPSGNYICKRIVSPKYGETFEVMRVHGRSHILFHWGNTVSDTEGCILVGDRPGYIGNGRAVLNSKNTFKEFLQKAVNIDGFHLKISTSY